LPTIRQIAKAARVSPMTVSFVLNNKPGQVSDETRDRVLRTVREMGYRPRAAIHFPREAAIHTIGIAAGVSSGSFVEGDGGYYAAILRSVLFTAEERGLNTLLFHRSLFHTEPHESIRTYLDGKCDGLLLVAPRPDMPLIPALIERGIPFVCIGDQPSDEAVSFVDVDNVKEAMAAVRHLIELGHRRIGFVGGPEFVRSACQRREGFRRALEEHGVPYVPEWDSGSIVWNFEQYDWIIRLMRDKTAVCPTAFFAWNDGAAIRTLTALGDVNRRIPEQVAVIGFDDDPLALQTNPPLTTLRQPFREIGAQAVEALVSRIKDPHAPAPRILLPTKLIVRDSTAPPPAQVS
jgi:DNA-binding LacI/PurR family transcriptional regulator